MADLALFSKTQLGSISDDKPARLTIQEFSNARLFVTDVNGGAKPNYQLLYTIGDQVFINIFSDRMSVWDLRGVHILTDCAGEESSGEPPFLTFYRKHNITTGVSVNMSFAGITLLGFLTELVLSGYNKEGVDGFAFSLKYLAKLKNLTTSAEPITKSDKAAIDAAEAASVGGEPALLNTAKYSGMTVTQISRQAQDDRAANILGAIPSGGFLR